MTKNTKLPADVGWSFVEYFNKNKPQYTQNDVESFLKLEMAEVLTTLIKKVEERKWNYHMAKDMDRKYVLALDDVVTLLREDLTKKD